MITTIDDMPIKYFDTLEYVTESKRIKEAGGNVDEFQVRQIETAIETAVRSVKNNSVTQDSLENTLKNFPTKEFLKDTLKNFATKADIHHLDSKIKALRYDTLRFVIWTGVGVIVTLGSMFAALAGMIAHALHWF